MTPLRFSGSTVANFLIQQDSIPMHPLSKPIQTVPAPLRAGLGGGANKELAAAVHPI